MRHRGLQLLALSTALTFSIGMGQPTMALASTPSEATQPLEMTVQVSEKGFLDQRGKPYGPKNPLTIPKGKVIKITFVFSESRSYPRREIGPKSQKKFGCFIKHRA